jgi:ribonuclease T1
MRKRKTEVPVWLAAVAVLLVVALYLLGGDLLAGEDRLATTDQTEAGAIGESGGESGNGLDPAHTSGESRFSDLGPVTVGELPPEAVETLDLIFAGGPFPFRRDDSVFQNREGLLPDRERGYYREYTVITPGEDDRGARRIVAGAGGDLYYTSDHYQSFREIVGIGS